MRHQLRPGQAVGGRLQLPEGEVSVSADDCCCLVLMGRIPGIGAEAGAGAAAAVQVVLWPALANLSA